MSNESKISLENRKVTDKNTPTNADVKPDGKMTKKIKK